MAPLPQPNRQKSGAGLREARVRHSASGTRLRMVREADGVHVEPFVVDQREVARAFNHFQMVGGAELDSPCSSELSHSPTAREGL